MNIPSEVEVWRFGGKDGNLKSQNTYQLNTGYSMICRTNGKGLTWERQALGVNLGYDASGKDHKVHIHLPDGQEREIRSGEQVALAIGGSPSFLRYAHRRFGINLEWTEAPVYQWRIYAPGGAEGQPIPTGSFVSVVNDKVEPDPDFLIYMDREVGADVGWTTSPSFWDSVVSEATKLAIKAAKTYIASKTGVPV